MTDTPAYGTQPAAHCVLPAVWLSVRARGPEATEGARIYAGLYEPDDDADGSRALMWGSRYYNEAMATDAEEHHDLRVELFEAAELLYLHASLKGEPTADLNLGYVLSYDRCEGTYREFVDQGCAERGVRAKPEPLSPVERERLAYLSYLKAARAGLAEACYKLGDLLRDGIGCDMDATEAFTWFCRAYELGVHDAPTIWGSAAMRLGAAYEEGMGCAQSFERALTFYERATTGLGIAVREGETWYRGALRRAEDGRKRVAQELDGRY